MSSAAEVVHRSVNFAGKEDAKSARLPSVEEIMDMKSAPEDMILDEAIPAAVYSVRFSAPAGCLR